MKRIFIAAAVLSVLIIFCSIAYIQASTRITASKTTGDQVAETVITQIPSLPTETPAASAEAVQTVPADATANAPEAKDSALSLEILSVTSPVKPGEKAILKAHTTAGAICKISVYYTSTRSAAKGLDEKTVEASGNVSWTWEIGGDRTPGSYRIEVTANLEGKHASKTVYFTIAQ